MTSSLSDLVEKLAAESREKGDLTQLTSFGMSFRQKDSNDRSQIMELLFDQLRGLRSGGLEVKIQPASQGLDGNLNSDMKEVLGISLLSVVRPSWRQRYIISASQKPRGTAWNVFT